MRNISISDIGDGLAMNIETINGVDIQIDCGSQQNSPHLLNECYFRRPNVFFLSHFHSDHYNGLLLALENQIKLDIENVFFPKLPKFRNDTEFLYCLFAINMTLGDFSSNMETDFLNLIKQINNKSFEYQALSQGDKIVVGGENIEILWPPKELNNNYFLKSVNNALEKFNSALEKDEYLKRNYEKIKDTGIIEKYRQEETNNCEQIENSEIWRKQINENYKIPKLTKDANKALRSIANRLSLAFHIDNRFLFMGDLEATEIKKVVEILVNKQTLSFNTMITPHHGTHWNNSLNKIKPDICISSIGKRLLRYAKNEYKDISETTLWTYLNGDIFIPFEPIYYKRFYHRRWY